jgi:hypothetical protein
VRDQVTGRVRPALLVVFAHGWHHGCGTCDRDLACFRRVLDYLSNIPEIKRERQVVGVFLGWRGRSLGKKANSLTLWNRNQSLSAEVATLSGRLREAQNEMAGQREQLAGARNVEELLASPAVRVAELSGKQPAPQAHAMLAYDGSTGRAVVLATGLPPCPEGHAYQLWLIADNEPLPGGTFKTDAQGRARLSDRLPPNHTAPTFAVTLEREGGVLKPEGDIFLIGTSKG